MSIFSQRIKRLGNRFGVRHVNDLKDITGKETYYDYAILLGKWVENDGDAREYYYDVTSFATSNDDTVVRPNSIASDALPGRWLKVMRKSSTMFVDQQYVGSVANVELIVTHTLDTREVAVQVWLLNQTDAVFTGADILLTPGVPNYVGNLDVGIESTSSIRVAIDTPVVGDYRIVVISPSFLLSPP